MIVGVRQGLLFNTALQQFKGDNLRGGGVSKLIVSTFTTWEPWNSSLFLVGALDFRDKPPKSGRILSLESLPSSLFPALSSNRLRNPSAMISHLV